uniref:Cyclin-dependent kinases regulatory subunit n=1 Tax=Poecilia latipinna TaxID=48699 RepID=A0A3B3U518_9TELE
ILIKLFLFIFTGNMSRSQIYYSNVYMDDQHVVLPQVMAKYVPKSHLMSEDEWRQLRPHILLFRRPLSRH